MELRIRGFLNIFRKLGTKRHALLTLVLCVATLVAYTAFYTQDRQSVMASLDEDNQHTERSSQFVDLTRAASTKLQTESTDSNTNDAFVENKIGRFLQPTKQHVRPRTREINVENRFDFVQPKNNDTIVTKNHTTQDQLSMTLTHASPSAPISGGDNRTPTPRPNRDASSEELTCKFPYQDPFHHSVLKRFSLIKTLKCESSLPTLVYRDGNYLRINSTRISINNISISNCEIYILKRKNGNDFTLEKSPPITFKNSIEIPLTGEHFLTRCFDYNAAPVSRGYFSIIRVKKEVEKRCETNYKQHVNTNFPKETLSVLLVGVDGLSRQNLIRSMNKTKSFVLNNLQAIELFNFNKVGDNTFPNIVPLLTGLSKKELLNKWPSQKVLDEIDHFFLWRDYQKAGYRTAMVIDRRHITAFHYLKLGWRYPTFDYYNRPMVLQTEYDGERKPESESTCCIGEQPEISFLLDNWLQLTSVFNNTKTKPYFGFSFLNRLTHENANRISMADELYLKFFQTLQSRRVLNNTLLIFFSDHGPRFGPARNTFNGILESRTPFAFLAFPTWFKKKYPEVTHTLQTNQHRLTTMFDLYQTLKDLLKFQGKSDKGSMESRGISLFNEIPKKRTCIHAGIPVEFCMCSNMKQLTGSGKLSNELAKHVVQHIVKLTEKIRDKCEELSLFSVEAVASVVEMGQKNVPIYQVIIETSPNKAVYEAVVKYEASSRNWVVVGIPVRLNLYLGQAECIDSAKLRPFCYCREKRENNVEKQDDDVDDDDDNDDEKKYSVVDDKDVNGNKTYDDGHDNSNDNSDNIVNSINEFNNTNDNNNSSSNETSNNKTRTL